MLTQKNYMKLEFPARSVNEGFARAAVAAFAAQLDPTLAEIGDIKTAVSEAVTNAVVHAYPDKLGTVQVRVRILPDERLEIVVKDHGIGIADVAQARTPLYTTGGEERSGMGFTIMESFMDTLRVKSVPGRGTTVTICRRGGDARPAPARSGGGRRGGRADGHGKHRPDLERGAAVFRPRRRAGRPVSARLRRLSEGHAGL